VSHQYVMHLACRAQACGASFVLLGPRETMLKSSKRVIAVTAVRTGAGKSPLSLTLARLLLKKKVRFVVIRHPMPYGDLVKEKVQRFATFEDLKKNKCTIEEREEYEPHIRNGVVVFAGVDYGAILKAAEKEADLIIWDGGNNDIPFIKPDLYFVVADALRPGHEMLYYPGETNFRSADIILINKVNENPNDVRRIRKNAETANPRAAVIETDLELTASPHVNISGKKAIVVEDGPTVTHGGMKFGAGYEYAKRHGAVIIDPRPHAVGSIKEVFKKFDHLESVLPAMGYYDKELRELQETINRSGAEIVVSGTPVDLNRVLKVKIPIMHVNYTLIEMQPGFLDKAIEKLLKGKRTRLA
jgi:predicted GTPase